MVVFISIIIYVFTYVLQAEDLQMVWNFKI